MTLCDTCALACDERKGWEVPHKCGATGELRPYQVKKCRNYERTRKMRQYIDKDALVAEIKRRRKLVSDPILSGNDLMIGERNALFNLLSFIDTLEVKEIDGEPRTSAENNDQIAYGYIAENDENK